MVMGGGTAHWLGPGRVTSNSEIIHLAGKSGFRRSDRNDSNEKLQSLIS
jgi:hypothetical protein